MVTIDTSHRIRVSSSRSESGTAWTVRVGSGRHAVFTGCGAKDRAVESALRLAEDLRASAAVVVVTFEAKEGGDENAPAVRGRIAS